jgi:DGQHR domain-containing protein
MKLQLPGVGYRQGGRQMVITAMNPIALIKTVAEPDAWNPVGSQPHGNRPQDKEHRKGIADYLEEEPNFVLGAVVLYAKPGEAFFVPDPNWPMDDERAPGTLYLDYGANFDVGDGQHRIGAYSDVMHKHAEDGDPVRERLHASGQPVVVVIDDNPLHRAQDFTDLQRNAKPPSTSIALSMDRRQPINRLLIDLVQDPGLPIFGSSSSANPADRIEFLKDSPGKLSAKLFSFKTVRFASGTLLGVGERSTMTWEKAVNTLVEDDHDSVRTQLFEFWESLGHLTPYANVIKEARTAAQVRDDTYLTSAGVLYAVAHAVHVAHHEHKNAITEFTKALRVINFDRPDRHPSSSQPLTRRDTIFAGSLVDPESGRIGAGRAAWEAAADAIRERILSMGASAGRLATASVGVR